MQIKTSADKKGQKWIELIGGHGDSVGKIRVKSEKRMDLAMVLLGLYGERAKVTISPPLSYCFVCDKPSTRKASHQSDAFCHQKCEPRPAKAK